MEKVVVLQNATKTFQQNKAVERFATIYQKFYKSYM